MSRKKTITSEEWQKRLQKVKIPKTQMNKLVMNYLVTEGYQNAAEKFQQESGAEAGVDLSVLENRMEIRKAIMKGQIDTAISLINDLDPEILDTNKKLNFRLRLQKLVEFIKNNNVSEALTFGQEELAPAAQHDSELLEELEKAMTLLAFEDLTTSPVSELVSPAYKQKLASDVNAAILKNQGLNQNSSLQVFMKMLIWSQKKLQNAVSYPKIKDLANAKFEEP